MHYRIPFAKVSWLAFALFLVGPAAGLGNVNADGPTLEQKRAILNRISHILQRRAFAFDVDFSQFDQFAEQNSRRIKNSPNHDAFAEVVNEMLDTFAMSHLWIAPPRSASLDQKGRRIGLGFHYLIEEDPLQLFVTYVTRGSPAWKAGLRKGDLIIETNGRPPSRGDLQAVVGEQVQLSWKSPDGGRAKKSIVFAEHFSRERSRLEWIEEDVAVVQVHSFQSGFYARSQVDRFFREARGRARVVILDLRNNHGGLFRNVQHLAGEVLPPSPGSLSIQIGKRRFARYRKRNGEKDAVDYSEMARIGQGFRPRRNHSTYTGPLAVLVDGASGSGGDLLPAALQENGRAIILGTKTFGALFAATRARLPQGYRLYFPVAEVLTPEGKRLESLGLEPDIVLSWRETVDDDLIYQEALEALNDRDPGDR